MLRQPKIPQRHISWLLTTRVLLKNKTLTLPSIIFTILRNINNNSKHIVLSRKLFVNKIVFEHFKKTKKESISTISNFRQTKCSYKRRCLITGLSRGMRWGVSRMGLLKNSQNSTLYSPALARW